MKQQNDLNGPFRRLNNASGSVVLDKCIKDYICIFLYFFLYEIQIKLFLFLGSALLFHCLLNILLYFLERIVEVLLYLQTLYQNNILSFQYLGTTSSSPT